jgi:hypothetical protein
LWPVGARHLDGHASRRLESQRVVPTRRVSIGPSTL